jgi:hypothetical protein
MIVIGLKGGKTITYHTTGNGLTARPAGKNVMLFIASVIIVALKKGEGAS